MTPGMTQRAGQGRWSGRAGRRSRPIVGSGTDVRPFRPGTRGRSLVGTDYAARTASELGADLVKVNFPQPRRLRLVAQLKEILAKYPS